MAFYWSMLTACFCLLLRFQKAKQEAGQTKKDAGQAARGEPRLGVGEEKPKTTRAERRAKQEAERAAKEAGVPKVRPLHC